MVNGVIFDMDGLMFDTERLWDTLWAPCCEKLGLPMPCDAFLAGGRGLAGDNFKKHLAKYYPQVDPQVMMDAVWALSEEVFSRGVPVKPGLRELLDWLEERGVPRIVASSSPRKMILTNLETTGTAKYFDQVICGPEVARSKPDPDIFLEAARRIGVPIGQCLVLEDSFNGVRAGAAAGAVTVMVPDMAQPTEEIRKLYTRKCDSLHEVLALLQAGAL